MHYTSLPKPAQQHLQQLYSGEIQQRQISAFLEMGSLGLQKAEELGLLDDTGENDLEKGRKAMPIGTKAVWGGVHYLKTASGWKPVGKIRGHVKHNHDFIHENEEKDKDHHTMVHDAGKMDHESWTKKHSSTLHAKYKEVHDYLHKPKGERKPAKTTSKDDFAGLNNQEKNGVKAAEGIKKVVQDVKKETLPLKEEFMKETGITNEQYSKMSDSEKQEVDKKWREFQDKKYRPTEKQDSKSEDLKSLPFEKKLEIAKKLGAEAAEKGHKVAIHDKDLLALSEKPYGEEGIKLMTAWNQAKDNAAAKPEEKKEENKEEEKQTTGINVELEKKKSQQASKKEEKSTNTKQGKKEVEIGTLSPDGKYRKTANGWEYIKKEKKAKQEEPEKKESTVDPEAKYKIKSADGKKEFDLRKPAYHKDFEEALPLDHKQLSKKHGELEKTAATVEQRRWHGAEKIAHRNKMHDKDYDKEKVSSTITNLSKIDNIDELENYYENNVQFGNINYSAKERKELDQYLTDRINELGRKEEEEEEEEEEKEPKREFNKDAANYSSKNNIDPHREIEEYKSNPEKYVNKIKDSIDYAVINGDKDSDVKSAYKDVIAQMSEEHVDELYMYEGDTDADYELTHQQAQLFNESKKMFDGAADKNTKQYIYNLTKQSLDSGKFKNDSDKEIAAKKLLAHMQEKGYGKKEKKPEQKPEITDFAEIQKVKNSIQEGENILRSGMKVSGKMSKEELDAVLRSVNSSRKKIGLPDYSGEIKYAKEKKEPVKKVEEKKEPTKSETKLSAKSQAMLDGAMDAFNKASETHKAKYIEGIKSKLNSHNGPEDDFTAAAREFLKKVA